MTAAVLFSAAVGAAEEPHTRFIAQTRPLSPAEQQKKFHLPPGFEIQLVAAEPDVRKPINLNFDAGGRLLVTGSVHYPYPADEPGTARDEIRVLADTDHDGVFERVKTLAGGLNIPVGVTPIPGGAMAFSVPNVYRFLDRDGDGRADHRQIAYGPFGFQDTHGMPSSFTWWIDGWIYGCHGEGNTSTVAGADGKAITLRGGNTFRMKADGSHIEYFTHGQMNPFGLCFDPLGNVYSSDSHSKPATMLLHGGWYPGPVGAPHDGLGFGPPMMWHYHDSTGIAGIAYYAAEHFPEEYQDALFVGNPVTGRINHDRLEVHGSTYRAIEQPDFLKCDDPWFRPVDVQVGPDGALYIADFYNRIIGHTVVPLDHVQRDRERGRIWRIVYAGKKCDRDRIQPVPNLASASLDQLLGYLRNPNLVVRTHATHQLVERIGNAAVAAVETMIAGDAHPWQRVHGLWVLQRLGALDEPSITRLASDPDRAVRVHLMKALAEQVDWQGERSVLHRLVLGKLSDPDAFVRRAATDALARHASEANIQPLMELWANTSAEDVLLIHAIRIALRDNLRAEGSILEVGMRSAARPEDQRRLADVSLGIRTRRSAQFVFDHLQRTSPDSARFGEFFHHAARYSPAKSLPKLYAFARALQQEETAVQTTVLKSLYRAAQERGAELPREVSDWGLRLSGQLLTSDEERLVYQGIELAWDLKLTQLGGQLATLAGRSSHQPALRSVAIDALGAVDQTRALGLLAEILSAANEPMFIREKAAETLGKLNDDPSRSVLTGHLKVAPARLAAAIARGLAHSQEGSELLLAAVAQGEASAHLLQDGIVDQLLRARRPPGLEARLAKLLEGLPPRDARLRRVVDQRQTGYSNARTNVQRGAKVFQKHCAICHQIGGEGNNIGPSLDGVGLRGLQRILEDTLDPNLIVDQSFRSSVIAQTNGQVIAGLVLREEGSVVVMASAEGKQIRISKGDIESRHLSMVSPMPANVDENIPEADFYHLIGYLLSQRQPIEPEK